MVGAGHHKDKLRDLKFGTLGHMVPAPFPASWEGRGTVD